MSMTELQIGAADSFPTEQDMLDSVPDKNGIYTRLENRFASIERCLSANSQTHLDYLLTLTANEWDASLSIIQTTYQKLLVKLKEKCAKAVCPMCHAGDPRFDQNGHEVHRVTVHSFEHGVRKQTESIVRCSSNPIWSMK